MNPTGAGATPTIVTAGRADGEAGSATDVTADGPAGDDAVESLTAPVDVLLADGSTATVRRAVNGDREAVAAFHDALSSESAAKRYFRAHPHLDEEDLDRICGHSPEHLALVAERDSRIVAVAELHRAVGDEEAEVAFVVDDTFAGRGLGTLLVEHLASVGRRLGVRRLTADVLATNRAMLGVFHDVGFAATRHVRDGVARVVLDTAATAEARAAADRRDTQAVVRSMQRVLRPSSVAVIGASRRPGTIGHELVRNLVAGGFQGPVYPVNPGATSVASLPAWPSVTAVPGPVDLAVVSVPAAQVLDVVANCGVKGVGALVVVSSGFAEVGGDGRAAQDAVTRLAHRCGMRLVGPNCFGVCNTEPDVAMNATFAPDPPVRGRVGFASQSGGLGIAILAEARARGLGLSSFVSMGNKADVSGNDLLAWWEHDDETAVALLYLESFGNPRRFARLARRIGHVKPIVAVTGGRTAAGRAAASSHTAAMASSEQAVAAMFRQSGVIRVDTVEELFDVSELLVHQPVPAGRRVGIVTNAGGPGVLAADACVDRGLTVPTLSPAVQAALRVVQPDAGGVGNPVDLAAGASAATFRRSVELLLASGEIDALVVVFTPPLVTRGADVARAVVAAVDAAGPGAAAVPVVATFLGAPDGRDILAGARRPVPCFTYPETAVRALAHVTTYGEWRTRPPAVTRPLSDIDANEARRRLGGPSLGGPTPSGTGPSGTGPSATGPSGTGPEAPADRPPAPVAGDPGGTWVTGATAMDVLRAYGIPAAPTVDVTGAEEAAEAAASLGGAMALKARGPGIVHKSDVGGVRLDLESPAAVADAYRVMAAAIGPAMTGATVQAMAAEGVELIAGFVQDPRFGPVVLVGLGGTAVELLGDHAVALAPISDDEARRMLLGLRGAPLLTGYRGAPPVDLDAVVDLVVRLGRLAEDLPEVAEADCNPVIARPDGALVVDARLRVLPLAAPGDDRRQLR